MKIIKLILVFMLLFSNVYEVKAINANNFLSNDMLLELAKEFVVKLDLSYSKESNYYLGSEISNYDLNADNKSYTLRTTAKLYPVYRDEKVIFTIYDMGGTSKISLDGVDVLNKTLLDSNQFVLLANETDFISYTNDKKTISIDINKTDNITILNDIEEIEFHTITKSKLENIDSLILPYSNNLNMPAKSQHTLFTCWAACIASFVHKYSGYNIDSLDVCYDIVDYDESEVPNDKLGYFAVSVSSLNNSTRNFDQIQQYLYYVYNISTSHDASFTVSDLNSLTNAIENNRASILGWINETNGKHVTVLTGYNRNSVTNLVYLYIMDPLPKNVGSSYYLVVQPNTIPINGEIPSSSEARLSETLIYNGVVQ